MSKGTSGELTLCHIKMHDESNTSRSDMRESLQWLSVILVVGTRVLPTSTANFLQLCCDKALTSRYLTPLGIVRLSLWMGTACQYCYHTRLLCIKRVVNIQQTGRITALTCDLKYYRKNLKQGAAILATGRSACLQNSITSATGKMNALDG